MTDSSSDRHGAVAAALLCCLTVGAELPVEDGVEAAPRLCV